MKAEVWGKPTEAVYRRLRWLRAIGITMIVLPCIAAVGAVGYRVAHWRGNSEAARCIAANAHAPEAERVQALVGMRRDVDLSIAVVRQMAEEPGEIGEQARLLLVHLAARLR